MLDGTLLKPLTDLITSRFARDNLQTFVREQLTDDAEKKVDPHQGFREFVAQLLRAFEDEGRLLFFVDCVIKVREDLMSEDEPTALLKSVRDELAKYAPSAESSAATVKSTVQGVAGRLQIAAVRAVVMESKDVLCALTLQIAVLNSYKRLHDALHRAKTGYLLFDATSKQMGSSPMGVLKFNDEVTNMERIVGELPSIIKDLPSSPSTIQQTERDWSDAFKKAILLARQCVETANSKESRKAVVGVRSVLTQQLPRIDGLLKTAAEQLDLLKLKGVFDKAAAVDELATDRPALTEGGAGVELLLSRVQAQVTLHGKWQGIDSMFALAPECLGKLDEAPEDFEGLWSSLIDSINPLIAADIEAGWAKRISPFIPMITAAFKAGDWPGLVDAFDYFRKEAQNCFFAVDTRLKDLADQVNTIGAPLTELLNKLSDS